MTSASNKNHQEHNQRLKKILIVCGEPSGEELAAGLMDALHATGGEFRLAGTGGDKMIAKGFEAWEHIDKMTALGFTEVARMYLRLRKLTKIIARRAASDNFQGAVLIDYVEFNLILAKRLHKLGIPVYFYVSAQVWAWRKKRIYKYKRYGQHIFCLFPFEVDIYQEIGMSASWHGHPIAGRIEQALAKSPEFVKRPAASGVTAAFLPGSRTGEVMKHFPVMVAALLIVARNRVAQLDRAPAEPMTVRIPAAREKFGRIMARALAEFQKEEDAPWVYYTSDSQAQSGSQSIDRPLSEVKANEPEQRMGAKLAKAIRLQVEQAAQISWSAFQAGPRAPLCIEIIDGHSVGALKGSQAVLTTSGTSVLETGFLRKAMAILYRVSEVSYRIYKPMATVTQLGIVNILAGRTFCQEFIQHDVTAGKVAPELERLLFDTDYRKNIEETLNEVVGPLDKGDPHPAIAKRILDFMALADSRSE